MRSLEPPESRVSANAEASSRNETREVFIAHDPNAGPVTGVKNFLVQASVNQLKANGHYDRYVTLIAPGMLEALESQLGPGWMPIEVVLAHYEACDKLDLNPTQTNEIGGSVGDRLTDIVLVSRAKKVRDEAVDLWANLAQMHRMWPRLYLGGSVQLVKLSPTSHLIEQRGFPQNRFRYFRRAQVAAIMATYESMGFPQSEVKFESYDEARDEAFYRIAWI